MIAKITHIRPNGHYDSQHGRLFKQQYVFEDGVELSANHKSENSPFRVGDEVEYEVTGSNEAHGSWGTVRKPGAEDKFTQSKQGGEDGRGGEDERGEIIGRSWALKVAVQMLGPLPTRSHDAVLEYMNDACVLAQVILTSRDTFPKFDAQDAVRARWDSRMAKDGEMPF